MPRYDAVLFDADNTLFDFDRSEREALAGLLRAPGHAPRTAGIVPTYEADSYRALEALILNQTPEYRNK